METIYINKQHIQAKKEIVYKKKLIIHDTNCVLVYPSRNNYRVPSIQGEEDLLSLVKEITGLNIQEEDINPIVRIISSYIRYDCHNNKLIPVIKEVVRDYYSYYLDLDNEKLDSIREYGNDWYQNPIRISKYKLLTGGEEFKKLKIPVKYLWKKER